MSRPASPADDPKAALHERIRAYPGTITYLDLIRRNKRQSVVLIAAMILLTGLVGSAIASAIAVYGGGSAARELAPSVIVGLAFGLLAAGLGTLWSWFGGASAILSISGARRITSQDDPPLFNVVDEVRIAAGLPMPAVYLIDDSALNAFATGRDPEHAAVAITTGLRERLTRDELQGVMAHEMAHVRHLDIRFSLLMATMVGLIAFACDAFLRMVWHHARWGGRGRTRASREKGGGAAIVIILIAAAILAILAPLIARLIQMAYSRQREYLADAGAVELTRNPGGLASALMKLAGDDDPLVDSATRGTAHMFIVNPLRKMRESHQSLNSLFWSHPPVKERIARLLALTR